MTSHIKNWLLAALVALAPLAQAAEPARAEFAGGCFWCMEPPYDALPGVQATISGYTGGRVDKPTYEQVSTGNTGHLEALQVVYDPAQVSYEKLLEVFWHNVDPLDKGGQFCDRGEQYTTAIFYHDDNQRRAAEASKAAIEKQLGKPVVTPILPAKAYFAAEDYHQDYYLKNELRYKFYRYSCGRDARLKEIWGESAGH